MDPKRIVIVEDDPDIARLIRYTLEKAGYACRVEDNGEVAFQVLTEDRKPPALVLLDLMVPGLDGVELCRLIRRDERLRGVPVIMLTARGEEVDRVVGFEVGADDYIVKPFSPRELVLRVRAVLKRREEPAPAAAETLAVGDLEMDMARHRVTLGGRELDLTLTEFNLLSVLIRRRGRVQSRDRLLSDVWQIEADITTRTIDTHVKRLRQKLGTMGEWVETVRGIGYRFREEG